MGWGDFRFVDLRGSSWVFVPAFLPSLPFLPTQDTGAVSREAGGLVSAIVAVTSPVAERGQADAVAVVAAEL